MKAEIKNIDGIDCIIITAPMQQPQLSSTKKSYLVELHLSRYNSQTKPLTLNLLGVLLL